MFRQKPPFRDRNSDYSHFRCHFLHRSHRQPKLLLSVVQFDVILPRVGFVRTKIGLSSEKNLISAKSNICAKTISLRQKYFKKHICLCGHPKKFLFV